MELGSEKVFESILLEINALRLQWEAEVGRGRRAWPRAIKSRVLELVLNGGFSVREVSKRTGVSYETITLWKHKSKKKTLENPGFQQLAVRDFNESATVTDTDSLKSKVIGVQITVRTPKGYVFEGLSQAEFFELIKCLGGLRVL